MPVLGFGAAMDLALHTRLLVERQQLDDHYQRFSVGDDCRCLASALVATFAAAKKLQPLPDERRPIGAHVKEYPAPSSEIAERRVVRLEH